MKKYAKLFTLCLMLVAPLHAERQETNTTMKCPHMSTVSKSGELSQSIVCYRQTYEETEKSTDLIGFIRSLKVMKNILGDTQRILDRNGGGRDSARLSALLRRLDISNQRFSCAMEREKENIKKLFEHPDEDQPSWLKKYYLTQLLPSIKKKLDTFFDRLERATTPGALEDLSRAYLTRLNQSEEKIDSEFLNIYTAKAKKKEPLNVSEKDIASDAMLSLYLKAKNGRIMLITLKGAYLDLAKKRDNLLERLTESE